MCPIFAFHLDIKQKSKSLANVALVESKTYSQLFQTKGNSHGREGGNNIHKKWFVEIVSEVSYLAKHVRPTIISWKWEWSVVHRRACKKKYDL